ncbi:hypothetical protein [Spirosoma sp.]|uniref:hypothetical protein n=1 Tax=Spirosoma sp. TaxID=1899569 RepID=UPI002622F537|nr:hypothetical protein [Spirosoma sp.]MCX6215275.1 hypothetical protein [Spirosoma sp.]
MNRRIRFDDLDSAPYKELIQTLLLQWIHAELPDAGLTYVDFLSDIRILLLTNQSPERTTEIVRAVLAQAIELRRTSAWVEQELKYEGMIEGADRADFLRFELEQSATLDDALLDVYNERMSRFKHDDRE